MGDPRRFRNKYERPKKLWDAQRIEEDGTLKSEYALKNMRELFVMNQELKKYRREARRMMSLTDDERKKSESKVLAKLNKFGILDKTATLDDVLSLSVRDILERRLQTRVYKKGLAKTMRQSRQFITHGMITVSGRKVSSPSYLVDAEDDATIAYSRSFNPAVLQTPAAGKPEKVETKESAVQEAPAKNEEAKPAANN